MYEIKKIGRHYYLCIHFPGQPMQKHQLSAEDHASLLQEAGETWTERCRDDG